jgi:plastocyanin domain-containing protein
MDSTEIVVLVAGFMAIAFVLWYFFFGERERTTAAVGAAGVQEIKITVKGGYSPDVIVVRERVPVRLNFYRDETASCSEQVIFDDFGLSKHLPPFKTTSIEFTPEHAGEYTFMCGMSMMRGKLIVEP